MTRAAPFPAAAISRADAVAAESADAAGCADAVADAAGLANAAPSAAPGAQRAGGHAAFVAIAAIVALVASGAGRAADLELTVDNVRSAQGALMIALYADAADYQKKPLRVLKLPAQAPSTTVRIADLSPGHYAITMYQDRNDNAKLDSNLLGIPSEPYGFSGNPGNLMSPATWEQARFAFGTDAPRVMVKLSD